MLTGMADAVPSVTGVLGGSAGSGLTFAEVLRLPLMASAEVIAGHARLATPVRWVHVSEVPDVARFVGEGALVLTHGIALDAPESQRQFVRQISEKGVTGLIVQLGWRFHEVPPEMVEEARRLELPLVALKEPTSFTDLTMEVHSRIVNSQYVVLQEAERFSQALMSLLIGQHGIQSILDSLGKLIDRPVLAAPHDASHQPNASPPKLATDQALLDALAAPLARKLIPLAHQEGELLTLRAPWAHAVRARIDVAGEAWGDLYVIGGEPTQPLELMALDRALLAVACEIARLNSLDLRWRSASGALLERLLRGGTPPEEVARQAALLGVTVTNRWLSIVVVGGDAWPGEFFDPPRLERLARRAMEDRGLGVLSTIIGDRVVLLVADLGRDDLVSRTREACRRIRAQVAQCEPVLNLQLGAGTPTTRLDRMSQAYLEAQRSLRVQAYPGGERDTLFLDAMGIYPLLAEIPLEDLADFAERELQPLAQYDAEHGSDLLGTLRALLDGNMRIMECAEALAIGRQTLYNRRERIEQRLGCSLVDPETRFRLGLALRIRALTKDGSR